jgi:hypothetical protein
MRERLTFSNVVSVIALCFAVGLGGAWAATELGRNDVKSRNIGKGQVKASDIGKNAVSSPKIADGGVSGTDVEESSLGKVPSASVADTAGSADSANSAGNAALLDNLDSTDLIRSDRFRFGTGDPTATTPQSLFSMGGIEVTTDGDADGDSTVRIDNRSGTSLEISNSANNSAISIGAAAVDVAYSTARAGTVVMHDAANPQRAAFLTCGNSVNIVASMRCLAYLSPVF